MLDDKKILDLFAKEPEKALGMIYDKYIDFLAKELYFFIKNKEEAEDIIQDLFLELWKKKKHIANINMSLKYYLKKAAFNRAINKVKKQKYFEDLEADDVSKKLYEEDTGLELKELDERIKSEIDRLPAKCRTIFMLSRYENMSYKEIAEQLDVSVKTVENQISKALKILRKKINTG